MQKILALKERLAALGYNKLEISIGDTPTCSLLDEFTGVDEIRPGTFVFNDQRQLGIGSCKEEEIAAAVACPVVGVYPQRSEIAIYGGAAHLSKDYNPQEDGSRCYGRAALLNAAGWGEALPHTSLYSLSQEIGLIKTTPEICQTIRTGTVLMILPAHICLTVNAMRRYTTLKGQVIDCMSL
jgi:D-serine deaminase-like pyridoxal phosphate-dependent protein